MNGRMNNRQTSKRYLKKKIFLLCSADCQYYFALSWIITWYSHVLENNEDILRLTDFFLASHPLMSVYVATSVSNDRWMKGWIDGQMD